jgi:hypothetical protein
MCALSGCLRKSGSLRFIVCVLGHLLAVHLQVNHQVAPPIVLLEFRGLELGRHCHVRNQDTLEKSVFRRGSSGTFSSKPSILPSNWESLPSGFGGVGGLGNKSMLM